MSRPRILIAGIGNIFFGDDAFGVAVARRLLERTMPAEARVVDFGIRGIDLAYALLDGYEAVILVDAMPRGGAAGELYVIEPDPEELANPGGPAAPINVHGLNPAEVLRMVRALGGSLPCLRVVGCEPAALGSEEEPLMELSAPVKAAVERALTLIDALVEELLSGLALSTKN